MSAIVTCRIHCESRCSPLRVVWVGFALLVRCAELRLAMIVLPFLGETAFTGTACRTAPLPALTPITDLSARRREVASAALGASAG